MFASSVGRGAARGAHRHQHTSSSSASSASHRRTVVAEASPKPTHYDVLGVDIDASTEDIKAAYRRTAKQLHPDVCSEPDAEDKFKAAKLAYETLTDEHRRREYDQLHRVRRLNFFQDVNVDEPDEQWGRAVDPWEVHRRMWEQEEERGGREAGSSGRDDEPTDPEELLERLARVMGGGWGGPGSLRQWQSGRLDPFGSSSSEAWHRRVQEQTDQPFSQRGRPLYGSGAGGREWGGAPAEWDPLRPGDDPFERQRGWSNPSRPEWTHPHRRGGEPDEEGGGRRGGGIPGGGDSFRGKPL